MLEGRSVKGTLHVPACRARLEARLREAGDPRVEQAQERVDGHIAERMQQQIQAEEEEAAATICSSTRWSRGGYPSVPSGQTTEDTRRDPGTSGSFCSGSC